MPAPTRLALSKKTKGAQPKVPAADPSFYQMLPVSHHELGNNTTLILAGSGCVIRQGSSRVRLDLKQTEETMRTLQHAAKAGMSFRLNTTTPHTIIDGDRLTNLCTDYQARLDFLNGQVDMSSDRIVIPVLPAASEYRWFALRKRAPYGAFRFAFMNDGDQCSAFWDLAGFDSNLNTKLRMGTQRALAEHLDRALHGDNCFMARPFAGDASPVQVIIDATTCLLPRRAVPTIVTWLTRNL